MEKSPSVKLFLISLPIFICFILGMIWYNANYIQKVDKEYTQLINSANISSNALIQTTINTSLAMHKCILLVLNDKNLNWKILTQNLDSIKSENSKLLNSLEIEAKTKEQKEKLAELSWIRAQLILQHDSLVNLAQDNKLSEARLFFLNHLSPNFKDFFKLSSDYIKLVQKNTNELSNKLTERNNMVKQINQYLFWLPIICLGLFAALILVIFIKVYSITKDELEY
jgi:hypothetical protein